MNTFAHRLIYHLTVGCLMAVGETARSCVKGRPATQLTLAATAVDQVAGINLSRPERNGCL